MDKSKLLDAPIEEVSESIAILGHETTDKNKLVDNDLAPKVEEIAPRPTTALWLPGIFASVINN